MDEYQNALNESPVAAVQALLGKFETYMDVVEPP